MPVDNRAMEIADTALKGRAPTRDDVLYLLSFHHHSPEAAYVNVRAREIAMRAGKGRAFVHAQIGVDALPCPENCRFCTFAAINTAADKGCVTNLDYEVPIDRIAEIASHFDEAGVHLISLMCTSGLSFERYLEMIRAVRASVSPDMPLMANMGDISLEQARVLKAAGIQAFYHARRIYEGELTDIEPELRYQTIRNVREAGLALMAGVEPLWQGVEAEELADRIMEIPAFAPYCTGTCVLSAAEGTEMEDEVPSPQGKARYVGSIIRLVCGEDVPFGGTGGAIWVDAGCDPRGRGRGHGREWILSQVRKAKRSLRQDEWIVAERPSLDFFEAWSAR